MHSNAEKIVPVVLAGGTGSRLWPVSRDALPKQFLPLVGKHSTYQETLLRVQNSMFASPIVITGPGFHFFAQRQAEELGIEVKVIVEPARRDSGPAVAAATAATSTKNPQALVLALTADHIVLDPDAFRGACCAARPVAEAGSIVTFGIEPTEPKTGYGYILPGRNLGQKDVYKVERFAEKPDLSTAARYLLEGYLWNSGNFLFRADVLLEELARLEPEIATNVGAAVAQATDDLGFLRLEPVAFARAPQKSIDFAIMEQTDRAAVVRSRFHWSDIGSWDALFDIQPHDQGGNVLLGPIVTLDTRNCLVHSDGRLTTLIGVENLVLVVTSDAVLLVPRGRTQEIRELVAELKAANRVEATDHRRVHRPWGYYELIDTGDRFQVKRIVVRPGGMLSLQKHRHRAEHWIVVRGTAEVTLNKSARSVYENESIYIPIGSVHRLANQGRMPLELIEVQTGSYLGEDDIIRLEDAYHRC